MSIVRDYYNTAITAHVVYMAYM